MEANNNAVREALVKIEKMAHCDLCNVYPQYRDKFNTIIGGIEREARAALKRPPRNCDIGTAEEQEVRFEAFCHAHRSRERCCEDCPILADSASCEFTWEQMPYVEGGAK